MKPAAAAPAAGKGRGAAPVAAGAAGAAGASKPPSRRGSISKPSAITSPLSPLGSSKPPVTLTSTGAAQGKAPAAQGTPMPGKAEVQAAAGKAPPTAAAPGAAGAAGAADAVKVGAAAAAKSAQAAEGTEAFIYEEYGFPSAAEPVPQANPLLIFSVLVSYFLFVAACFLIIKYAYHGYDVNAPDVHTVTSKDIHAPLQFDQKDLEDAKPPTQKRRSANAHASARRRASTAAAHSHLKAVHGRGKAKRTKMAARSKRVRRRSTASSWENERVTMMGADVDYGAEVPHTKGAVEGAGHRRRAKTMVDTAEKDGGDDDAAPSSRRTARPKNLNKSG